MKPSVRRSRAWKLAAALLVAAGGSGCASTSVWRSHPGRMREVLAETREGRYDPALQQLARHCKGADRQLYLMERARVAQLAGRTDISLRDFDEVERLVRADDEDAVLRASAGAAQLAALALNDNAIPYRPCSYERIFVHQLQALNWLFTSNAPAAGVETRRAMYAQAQEEKRHQDEAREAAEQARKKGVEVKESMDNANAAMARMDAAAARVKSSFQNGYALCLAGLFYEAANDPDNAFVAYKKALDLEPGNAFLRRLARRFARDESEREALGAAAGTADGRPAAGEGELAVFFECGFAPAKQDIKIPIITFNGLVMAAFPYYGEEWADAVPLRLRAGGLDLGATAPLCRIHALAARALKEQRAAMITRAVLRLGAKAILAKQVRDAAGWPGIILVSIYNFFSENADLRSWLTLPHEIQFLRQPLPAGSYALECNGQPAGGPPVRVEKKHVTVVRVIETGAAPRVDWAVLPNNL